MLIKQSNQSLSVSDLLSLSLEYYAQAGGFDKAGEIYYRLAYPDRGPPMKLELPCWKRDTIYRQRWWDLDMAIGKTKIMLKQLSSRRQAVKADDIGKVDNCFTHNPGEAEKILYRIWCQAQWLAWSTATLKAKFMRRRIFFVIKLQHNQGVVIN